MADNQNKKKEAEDTAKAAQQAQNLHKVNQAESHKKPEELLGNILRGEIEEIDDLHYPFVINGHKINNKILRVYILKLRVELGWDDGKILSMLTAMDEIIEKGIIDNKTLDKLKDNPDLLNTDSA